MRSPQKTFAQINAAMESALLTPADFKELHTRRPGELRPFDPDNHIPCRVRPALPDGTRSGTAGSAAPPLLTGGERVEEPDYVKLVMVDGEIKEVMKRRGYGGSAAVIDWLNFTCHEKSYNFDQQPVTDEEVINAVSLRCEMIFGFGITARRDRGANFYRDSYVLGSGFGMVCHGGQRGTVLITLSGDGCTAALPGWEKRLHDFLTVVAIQPRITRCDLAHDFYNGEYTVDKADEEFESGLFSCGGRMPDCEHRGNWRRPNGKGRSFYVGHRRNGKYARIYEKGRQLGDPNSEWVRAEVEFKSVDRVIPFEILLNPGEYLAAAYPAFAHISETQCRIKTTTERLSISYEKTVEWLKKQCGAAINAVVEIEGSAEAAIQKVVQFGKLPARLIMPMINPDEMPVHRRPHVGLPLSAVLASVADF